MGRGESDMPDRGGRLGSPPDPALPRVSSCPLPWEPCREGEGRPEGSVVPHFALLASAACTRCHQPSSSPETSHPNSGVIQMSSSSQPDRHAHSVCSAGMKM